MIPLPKPSTNALVASGRTVIGKCASRYWVAASPKLEASLLPEMAKYKQRFLGRKEVVPRPELYDPPQVRVKSHLKLIVNNG